MESLLREAAQVSTVARVVFPPDKPSKLPLEVNFLMTKRPICTSETASAEPCVCSILRALRAVEVQHIRLIFAASPTVAAGIDTTEHVGDRRTP